MAKLREYCLQQECELSVMRLMLRQNGIDEPTVLRSIKPWPHLEGMMSEVGLRPPPAVRTLSVIAEVAKEQESTSDSSEHSPSATPLIPPPPPSPPPPITPSPAQTTHL